MSAQISGIWESPTNDCWRQKTTVPGLSRGVVCVIIRLAILTQYQRVTDGHTKTHTTTVSTALEWRRADKK